jgi:hypothetical protein
MEGVYWYTSRYPHGVCICAEFDGRTRRVRLATSIIAVRYSFGLAALVQHAVEQITASIKEARSAAAQRAAFSELH